METLSGKFVVLHHTGYKQDHYDLLLEREENLLTWQFSRFPSDNTSAEQIFAHRRIYLQYEGPVSKNRGHVKRVDEGNFIATIENNGCWKIQFIGQKLTGEYTFVNSNNMWKLARVKNPHPKDMDFKVY